MDKEIKREKTAIGVYKRNNRGKQSKRWADKNRDKKSAHNAVYFAIKVGKIKKNTFCEICKEEFPLHMIYAHHKDYSKKLEVVWLCFWCHYKIHNEKEVKINELHSVVD